jgi:hypothetical protein
MFNMLDTGRQDWVVSYSYKHEAERFYHIYHWILQIHVRLFPNSEIGKKNKQLDSKIKSNQLAECFVDHYMNLWSKEQLCYKK